MRANMNIQITTIKDSSDHTDSSVIENLNYNPRGLLLLLNFFTLFICLKIVFNIQHSFIPVLSLYTVFLLLAASHDIQILKKRKKESHLHSSSSSHKPFSRASLVSLIISTLSSSSPSLQKKKNKKKWQSWEACETWTLNSSRA